MSGSTFSQTKKKKRIIKHTSEKQVDTTKTSGSYDAQVSFSKNGLPNVKQKVEVQFKSQAVQELEKLIGLNFVSGTIFFTGFGFTNPLSTKASDTTILHKYYKMSRLGTIITFDNCIYKNANGSFSAPLNKSLKLE